MHKHVEPSESVSVSVKVNGTDVRREIPARMLLSDFLREELGLTGTHVGCEHGICGACTVMVGADAIRSCLCLAVQVDGTEVTTVEGQNTAEGLNSLQQAFKDQHALQCGFCTPGFLMTIAAADPDDHPDDAAIRELLSGNVCRCTGYDGIVAAVRQAWGRQVKVPDAAAELSEK
jgi:carbon-monoxide dehydrogenase small subunit